MSKIEEYSDNGRQATCMKKSEGINHNFWSTSADLVCLTFISAAMKNMEKHSKFQPIGRSYFKTTPLGDYST